MASESLAEKYRPRYLDDVVGQERPIKIFKTFMRKGMLPSTMLLAGPPGTGKTTMGRILTAVLTCRNLDRENLIPCRECDDCKVAERGIGTGANFMHMDGAGSNLKDVVENELKTFVYGSPVGGSPYRVALIDEAQRISASAKEALLTLTENMPKRSVIVMTTMEPEAIPAAILSRSQKFYFNDLPEEIMVTKVTRCMPEMVGAEEALGILAAGAYGCMREMWQLVQSAIGMDEPLTPELAAALTSLTDKQDRDRLWKAIDNCDFQEVVRIWRSLIGTGHSFDKLGNQLMEDLLVRASMAPNERDWTRPIRLLSQASIYGKESGWRHALLSICENPKAPKQTTVDVTNINDIYNYMFKSL